MSVKPGIYNDYVVTDCGKKVINKRSIYECHLSSGGGHSLYFSLYPDGAERDRVQYEAIVPHIRKGDLLHCELGWIYYDDGFYLCLFGFIKLQPMTIDGRNITMEAFMNFNRGFWARTESKGDWVLVPGYLGLGGENRLPIKKSAYAPELYRALERDKHNGGYFTWVPKEIRKEGFWKKFLFFLPILREKRLEAK